MNIVENIVRLAAAEPDRVALVSDGRELTYGRLVAAARRVGGKLAQLGVQPGDLVALAASALVPHIILSLGIAWRGAVAMPVPNAERAEVARACGARLLLSQLPEPALDWPDELHAVTLADLRSMPDPAPTPHVRTGPEDAWRIYFSSGTTGRPKPVVASHRSAVLKAILEQPGLRASDRVMICMAPWAGLSTGMWLQSLHRGSTLVAPQQAGFEDVLDAVRDWGVTVLMGSADFALRLAGLFRDPARAEQPPPAAMRLLVLGGAALAPSLVRQMQRHLTPEIVNRYGSTETGCLAVADTELLLAEPACAGRLQPWVEVQAVDPAGVPLPQGEVGLLRARSPTLSTGYLADEAQAADGQPRFRDGWFLSTDRGRITADGRVHLHGRDSDVINLAGHKLDPARVEAVILGDPRVRECAVIDVPDAQGRPRLLAVVVAGAPLGRRSVMQRCRDALTPDLVPAGVVLASSLPRNEAGKVMRDQLRRRIQRRAEAAQAGLAAPAERVE